jgi:uncharacterized protein YjiS (DUF1127 family)
MRAEPQSAFTTGEPFEPVNKPVAARVVTRLRSLWRAWRNRRLVMPLLAFDDRMLSDIGLTRSDVTGALALPTGEDPSIRLARASRERRDARRWALRQGAISRAGETRSASPGAQPGAR